MEKIRTNTRVAEVNNAADRILTAYNNAPVSDAALKSLIVTLRQLSTAMTTAIKQDKALSMLESYDAQRDTAWVDMLHLIQGYTHSPLHDMRTAAIAITAITDKYGMAAAKANYATQSTLMESAMEDLSAETLKASIAALPGLAEAIAALRSAQTQFHNHRVEYQKALAAESLRTSASELKRQVLDIINNKIIAYINGMMIVQPDKYNDFASTLSKIIADNNTVVARRQSDETSATDTSEPTKD